MFLSMCSFFPFMLRITLERGEPGPGIAKFKGKDESTGAGDR